MAMSIYKIPNGRRIRVLYPTGGRSNVMRLVDGYKVRSYTGPSGKGATVHQIDGKYRSISEDKCIPAQ